MAVVKLDNIKEFRRLTSEIHQARRDMSEAQTRLEQATDELSHLSIEVIVHE